MRLMRTFLLFVGLFAAVRAQSCGAGVGTLHDGA
jgi:hypothetical protein